MRFNHLRIKSATIKKEKDNEFIQKKLNELEIKLNNNDKDLFESADRIEHELKLLMDKNTIFERW